MNWFKSVNKKNSIIYIFVITILVDLAAILAAVYIDEYVLNIFLKMFLIGFNLYQIYYIALSSTLKVGFDENGIYISRIFGLRNTYIPYNTIEKYTIAKGNINAVKLSGHCDKHFALGYCAFIKLGLIHMFVTSNENIIYIKTENGKYGISPENWSMFERSLISRGINCSEWTSTINSNKKIYKDNKFIVPFVFVTIIILILTVRPLYLYINNQLPASMPLSFSTNFKPLLIGTNKDFVFRQMAYGAFNMAILFCMYYAAYFTAKYSRKLSYIYIYAALFIALVFLIIQQNILINFA